MYQECATAAAAIAQAVITLMTATQEQCHGKHKRNPHTDHSDQTVIKHSETNYLKSHHSVPAHKRIQQDKRPAGPYTHCRLHVTHLQHLATCTQVHLACTHLLPVLTHASLNSHRQVHGWRYTWQLTAPAAASPVCATHPPAADSSSNAGPTHGPTTHTHTEGHNHPTSREVAHNTQGHNTHPLGATKR